MAGRGFFVSPPSSDDEPFYFEGFSSPRFTQVPDAVFDVLMSRLSEAEFKVLCYIVRRTFGFRKDEDDISLKQLVEGIRTRDGRQLDGGTGLSKSSAARGVRGLVEKGVLLAVRNRSEEKGDEPTTYRLRFQDDPVSQFRTRGDLNLGQARVSPQNTQETVEPRDREQETDLSKGPKTWQGNWKQAPGWCHNFMEDFSREFGDAGAVGSNITRLWRLWQASGIDELHFSPLIYQARTITHKQPFTGYDDEEPGPSGLRGVDRMPYYFRVLEDLVAEHNGAPHVEHPPHPITEERLEELRRYNEGR